jgi:hypothetical protein
MSPQTVEMNWIEEMHDAIAAQLRRLQDLQRDPNSGVWSGQVEGIYGHLVKAQHQLMLLERGLL